MYRSAIFVIWIFLFLAGCSAFTAPKEKPVITDKVGLDFFGKEDTTVFSLTPERRTVVVVKSDSQNAGVPPLQFCAEPPPDVAEGLASSLRALAEASVDDEKSKISAQGAAELSKSLSTSINTLFTRSQGVQVFRDGLFALCQAYINRIIGKEEYKEIYSDLLIKSYTLVLAEIPNAEVEKTIGAARRAEEARTGANSALNEAQAAQKAAESAAKSAREYLEKAKQEVDP